MTLEGPLLGTSSTAELKMSHESFSHVATCAFYNVCGMVRLLELLVVVLNLNQPVLEHSVTEMLTHIVENTAGADGKARGVKVALHPFHDEAKPCLQPTKGILNNAASFGKVVIEQPLFVAQLCPVTEWFDEVRRQWERLVTQDQRWHSSATDGE